MIAVPKCSLSSWYHTCSYSTAAVYHNTDAVNYEQTFLTPWELPADWSKWVFNHIEPIREGVKKYSLMHKFVVWHFQSCIMIGLKNEEFMNLINQKIMLEGQ